MDNVKRQMHHHGRDSWRHTTLPKSIALQELFERRQAAFQRLQYEGITCQHAGEAEDEIHAGLDCL